jgi:hypothetical protein
LHLHATFYALQMLFYTCRPHFVYLKCCFAPVGHSNSLTLLRFCKGILISYES